MKQVGQEFRYTGMILDKEDLQGLSLTISCDVDYEDMGTEEPHVQYASASLIYAEDEESPLGPVEVATLRAARVIDNGASDFSLFECMDAEDTELLQIAESEYPQKLGEYSFWYIQRLDVVEAYRGQKLGLLALEMFLLQFPYEGFYLIVPEDGMGLIEYYKGLGFFLVDEGLSGRVLYRGSNAGRTFFR